MSSVISKRCGPVHVEARHTPALHAQITANLFEVVDTAFGARAIIGDVWSEDLPAASLAHEIQVAFGELARHEPRLPGLARRLDTFVAERSLETGRASASASLLQIGAVGDSAELLVCGHLAPLVIRDGRAGPIRVLSVDPVLGRRPAASWCSPTAFDLSVGDALLAYTRGATEIRDALGRTYPFERRAAELAGKEPQYLLERMEAELLAHGDGRAGPEITLLFLRAEEPGFLGYTPETGRRGRNRSAFR